MAASDDNRDKTDRPAKVDGSLGDPSSPANSAMLGTQFIEQLYDELRAQAARFMQREYPGQTLTPTSLVHEAFIRLDGERKLSWANREHYFGAATQAMERILIDNARQKATLKRGGGHRRVARDLSQLADTWRAVELEGLFAAVRTLEKLDPGVGQVVRLRLLAGLTSEQIARVADVNERTVRRRWEAGRKWLAVELGLVEEGDSG